MSRMDTIYSSPLLHTHTVSQVLGALHDGRDCSQFTGEERGLEKCRGPWRGSHQGWSGWGRAKARGRLIQGWGWG